MSVVGERLAGRRPDDRVAAAAPVLITLAGLTVVAALIRFIGLTRQSLWVDEASTMAFTQRGFHGMLDLLVDYEANALVYYVLVYPVTLLDGSLASLRAVSALAGRARRSPPCTGLRSRSSRVAPPLIGCAALCLNAHAITQSQNARPYALVMLLTILSYGLLTRACAAGGTRRQWLLYGLTTVLVIYLNSLCGLLLLAAHLIVPLARGAQDAALVAPGRGRDRGRVGAARRCSRCTRARVAIRSTGCSDPGIVRARPRAGADPRRPARRGLRGRRLRMGARARAAPAAAHAAAPSSRTRPRSSSCGASRRIVILFVALARAARSSATPT